MASGKFLGMSLGLIVVLVLVLPLAFVRGLVGKIPVVGGPVAGVLGALGGILSKIPVAGKFY